MNNRRKLIIALGALCVGLARAQPAERAGKIMRVGIINYGTRASSEALTKLFIDAMRDLGWVEGRNIIYDNVYADNDVPRLPAIAAELVARTPDLIWTMPTAATVAAHASTRTIPIVFGGSNGVVELGLVKTLAHPGGNVTGVQNFSWELGGKRLQLLKQALPKIKRVGVLVQPDYPLIEREFNMIEKAAATLGLTVIRANAKVPGDIDGAIASLVKNRVEALLSTQTALFQGQRKRILALAASRQLPVVGVRSEFAEDGALISYSFLIGDQYRISARIVDKILKGAKPADIPVEQPTKFDLAVNLKTAKTLGITLPGEIMLQATRVIE